MENIMKITASQLRSIIKEEVAAATGMPKRVFKTPADAILFFVQNDSSWWQAGKDAVETLARGEEPSGKYSYYDSSQFPKWKPADFQTVLTALDEWTQILGDFADVKLNFRDKYGITKQL